MGQFSVEKPVAPGSVLSGNQQLFDPPNFLVLDEPTNHLDLLTKEMLIGALTQYEGAMLFVSHDRHFLAALSNRVLELTPEGVHQYAGGYTEYVARTGHEAPVCKDRAPKWLEIVLVDPGEGLLDQRAERRSAQQTHDSAPMRREPFSGSD
jgi:ATPase subunit of ABC transporter with duplicated ATPase domains